LIVDFELPKLRIGATKSANAGTILDKLASASTTAQRSGDSSFSSCQADGIF